jgi:hypothetical protein
VFGGSVTAPDRPGRHGLTVALGGFRPPFKRTFIVESDVKRRTESPDASSLSMLAASHGGVDVTPDRLELLEAHLRKQIIAPAVRTVRHPMRSAWWMVPFSGCLAIEWWMRRRRGLR